MLLKVQLKLVHAFTGIEGLSVYAAMGENNNQPTTGITGKADLTAFAAVYTMGAISVGYQVNETDHSTASQDEDFTAMGVSYAVSDDLSVSYNVSEIDFLLVQMIKKLHLCKFLLYLWWNDYFRNYQQTDNVAGTATADNSGYEINFSFAF